MLKENGEAVRSISNAESELVFHGVPWRCESPTELSRIHWADKLTRWQP